MSFEGFPISAALDAFFPQVRCAGVVWEGFSPAADVREQSDKYLIEFDVPGLVVSDVVVTLDNRELTVRGERKPSGEGTYTRQERAFGSFSRTFRLPQDTDPARIDARCANGVLTVSLGKLAQAQAKAIPVQGE
jgi:HSP20 family protein